jgi:cellulose synthase/poly-beta-1,6-N-acetylglucosamine synthase-like glycosyltransferase
MHQLILIVLIALASLTIFHIYFTTVFVSSSRSTYRGELPEAQLSKVMVVLCLRGADPFLAKCLQALLEQNYPDYELKIIVDSLEDEAWEIAAKVTKSTAIPVQIEPLHIRHQTCSLKCSSLIQAVSDLDEDCEVIAFVDADTVVHPNWLRELVLPLQNNQIGATTGNRWYVPRGQWGTLSRYVWNVVAVGLMYSYQIPWGGSLAMKTKLLRKTSLLKRWEQAFCEDTMILSALQEQGLKLESVPSLIMVNQEECDLKSFGRWVSRQLLNVRLYHPKWQSITIYGTLTTLIPLLAIILLPTTLLTAQWDLAVEISSALVIYTTLVLLLILIWELEIRRRLKTRLESLPKLTIITILKLLLAMPLNQLVCVKAIAFSLLTRKVEWRGINYQIEGPWNVRLIKDLPYQHLTKPTATKSL